MLLEKTEEGFPPKLATGASLGFFVTLTLPEAFSEVVVGARLRLLEGAKEEGNNDPERMGIPPERLVDGRPLRERPMASETGGGLRGAGSSGRGGGGVGAGGVEFQRATWRVSSCGRVEKRGDDVKEGEDCKDDGARPYMTKLDESVVGQR